MPRKKLIRSSIYPYHVTSRSNNKEWFYIPIQDVWGHSYKLLNEGANQFNVQIDAFVLMNNHYHLCIHTPDANIDMFMQFFNKNLGKEISKQAGRINRIFGAPYKWSLIKTDSYYQHVIRYIYQNPLRAGLVQYCRDYPYSDLMKQNFTSEMIEWIEKEISPKENKRTFTNLKKFLIK